MSDADDADWLGHMARRGARPATLALLRRALARGARYVMPEDDSDAHWRAWERAPWVCVGDVPAELWDAFRAEGWNQALADDANWMWSPGQRRPAPAGARARL